MLPESTPTASIPANVGGVFYLPVDWVPQADPNARAIAMRVVQGALETPIAAEIVDLSLSAQRVRFAVHTSGTLPVGSTLVVSARASCGAFVDGGLADSTDVGRFLVVDAVPLPTTLGTLAVNVEPVAEVPIPASSLCYELVPTTSASVVLEPSADAAPWIDAMVFETLVDGALWDPILTDAPYRLYAASQLQGGSWKGRARDEVFASCGRTGSPLTEGAHTIRMRGRLPDGTVVETPSVSVTFQCPSDSPDAPVARAQTCAAADHGAGATKVSSAIFALAWAAIGLRMRRRAARSEA